MLEARNRVYTFYVFYGYPSLFADGVDLWPISTWRPWLSTRMATPSPIVLNISGDYDPVTNNGTVTASFYNESTSAITARAYFVITEDSLYHPDSNGHAWHNKLARDFLPSEIGEQVTIDPSASVEVTRLFTIDPTWDEDRCNIVTWIQADAPSREGYQAGKIPVMDLVGIDEIIVHNATRPAVALVNNPCSSNNVRFVIELLQGTEYRIDIFDVLGRNIYTYTGTTSTDRDVAQINLNQNDDRVTAGVYLYRFTSKSIKTTGKIIVK